MMPDPARRWRRFGRRGRQLALAAGTGWALLLALVLKIAPQPEPLPRPVPPRLEWRPEARFGLRRGRVAEVLRVLWSPVAFALPSPAGFSHALRRERARIGPSVDSPLPSPAFFEGAKGARDGGGAVQLAAPSPAPGPRREADPVFPPRPVPAPARQFPPGWSAADFTGLREDYAMWADGAWRARVEAVFDADGLPRAVLLTASSGEPDVDRRLVRGVRGWRLRNPDAPRAGVVEWRVPAGSGKGTP